MSPGTHIEAVHTEADILSLLEEEEADYRAMHAVALAQRESLGRDDMEGVNASLARTNALMGRIQLRRARLPADLVSRGGAALAQRRDAIRSAIMQVEGVRRANEETVRGLLEETRRELRQTTKGRKVARGYRAARVEEARFYDGRR